MDRKQPPLELAQLANDPAALDRLADTLATHLARRLVSERMRSRWGQLCARIRAELLAEPLGRLVDRERARTALAAALSPAVATGLVGPVARRVVTIALARASARDEPLEAFVPDEARQALDELVAQPDLVPGQLVRELLRDPAVEAVMHDLLFEALRQFSVTANPFVADWGLPAVLRRLPPLGRGTLRAAFESMRADFDRRIEPEIRKFVEGFSRRGIDRVADLLLRKQDEPEFVALRQHVVAALLKRPLGELCWPPDDGRARLFIDTATAAIARAPLHEAVQAELETLLEQGLAAHGSKPVGQWLTELGVELPDAADFAQASWPVAEAILGGAEVRSALAQLLREALDDWLAAGG